MLMFSNELLHKTLFDLVDRPCSCWFVVFWLNRELNSPFLFFFSSCVSVDAGVFFRTIELFILFFYIYIFLQLAQPARLLLEYTSTSYEDKFYVCGEGNLPVHLTDTCNLTNETSTQHAHLISLPTFFSP